MTRRTKRKLLVFRTINERVEIPRGALLEHLRRADQPGPVPPPPVIQQLIDAGNPNLHVFEYEGETLFMPFGYGFSEATDEVEA